jgi:predicted lactoylglutathione lyase
MQYTKIDNTLKVTRTKYNEDGSTYEIENSYDKTFLENQINAITSQRDEMIALKEAELEEVQTLLDKCTELGIN